MSEFWVEKDQEMNEWGVLGDTDPKFFSYFHYSYPESYGSLLLTEVWNLLFTVTEFSKKTGDYPSLSATDIQVLALTYQLEAEFVGVSHLKQEPEKVNKKDCWFHPFLLFYSENYQMYRSRENSMMDPVSPSFSLHGYQLMICLFSSLPMSTLAMSILNSDILFHW